MNILITAGATVERIDAVRGITNFATGRLGTLIATRFLAAGHRVTLLAGSGSARPEPSSGLTVLPITDATSLATAMAREAALADVVIHSMATSDYRPIQLMPLEHWPVELTGEALRALRPLSATDSQKISSAPEYQLMILKKNPKIISQIKAINPAVILFGFKLLSDVPQETLIASARDSLAKNKADYILANDLSEITAKRHHAYLVSPCDIMEANTKSEIATLIFREAIKKFDQSKK